MNDEKENVVLPLSGIEQELQLPPNVRVVRLPSVGGFLHVDGYRFIVKYVDRKHGEIRIKFHSFLEDADGQSETRTGSN